MSVRQAMFEILVVSLMEQVEGLTVEQATKCAVVALEVINPK